MVVRFDVETTGWSATPPPQRGLNSGIGYSSLQEKTLASYESLVAGGNLEKEVLIQRSEENFQKILNIILREYQKQKLSHQHFSALNTYVLHALTMLLTLVSAVVAILSTSELVDTPLLKVKLSLGVAVLQLTLSLV